MNEVEEQSRRALIGAVLDCVLAGMLVISVVINCMSLGKPLREAASSSSHKKITTKDNKVYGRLAETTNGAKVSKD